MWESPLLREEDSFTLVAWERKFQDKRIRIHRMIIKNPGMKKIFGAKTVVGPHVDEFGKRIDHRTIYYHQIIGMTPMEIIDDKLFISFNDSHDDEDPFTIGTCGDCSKYIFLMNGEFTCHVDGDYDIVCKGRSSKPALEIVR